MDTTLRQVGQLLLDSIPTIVMLLLLYAIYQNLVRKPLEKVLAERRARTEGALEKARADVGVAESRTQDYEQKLREARLAIFKAQEARRQQAQLMRNQALEEARAKAQEQIRAARAALEQESEQARAGLQAEADHLASEIIRTILKPAAAISGIGGPA
jgi:F-type H+-transporting ATPase subunit b